MKTIYFILGPPRSGIGVLSSCLRIMSLTPLFQPDQLEPATIDAILLQDLGVSLLSTSPLPTGWLETVAASRGKKRISKLLASSCGSLPNHPSISRSPRGVFVGHSLLSHTLPLWQAVIESVGAQLKYIFLLRHPWEVSQSLVTEGHLDLNQAHSLWLCYTLAALRALKGKHYMLITFDQLLSDPAATLNRLLFPELASKQQWGALDISALLGFVTFNLKHHHSNTAFCREEQNSFCSFSRFYNQIVIDNKCKKIDKKYVMPVKDKMNFQEFQKCEFADTIEAGLLDSLLAFNCRYERKPAPRLMNGDKKGPIASLPLAAKAAFPSGSENKPTVKTVPLIENEWQRISLPVPEPTLLKSSPVMFNPLNTCGSIKISSAKLIDLSRNEVLWSVKTPQEFDCLEVAGTALRIPDLDNMVLVSTGSSPTLRFPQIPSVLNSPACFHIWLKPSRAQEVLHVTGDRLKEVNDVVRSRLVWLASFPRSGNTLLRIMLKNNFGHNSYSIYNDIADIGRFVDVSEVVGHEFMDWSLLLGKGVYGSGQQIPPEKYYLFDAMRYKSSRYRFVKTHSGYHSGFFPDRAIYVCRDGRAAISSLASYIKRFRNKATELVEVINELLLRGDELFGKWNDHVLSWMEHPREKLLVLKYEDILSDYNGALKKISTFLKIDPIATAPIPFSQLQSINADFFRKGQKASWKSVLGDTSHALFWLLNYEGMNKMDYMDEKPPDLRIL